LVQPLMSAYSCQDGGKLHVLDGGRQSIFEMARFEAADDGSLGSGDGTISVPMHGKIIAVTVSDGDTVEQGDMLFSVEAMKMEHAVLAPDDGVIADLAITAGEQVENGFSALKLIKTGAEN